MTTFNHFNFNVLDPEKSLAFYKEALNLTPVREKTAEDGSFRLVYLGDEAGRQALQPGGVRVPPGLPHQRVRRPVRKAQGHGLRLL